MLRYLITLIAGVLLAGLSSAQCLTTPFHLIRRLHHPNRISRHLPMACSGMAPTRCGRI